MVIRSLGCIFGLFLTTLTLTACQTLPPESHFTKTPWKERKNQLTSVKSWSINGKIALRSGNLAGSATVDWQQTKRNYYLSLYGPLGANRITLKGQPGLIVLKTSDGKEFSAHTPEALLMQEWGWNLPISRLNYWIRGLPVPGLHTRQTFDLAHRLATLSQDGWFVEYLRYTNVAGIDLPTKISIKHANARVKMMIYRWEI